MKSFVNFSYAAFFWIVVLFAGFLAFDKVFMPVLAGRYKERVESPKVEGLTAEEAERILREKGLNFYWMPEAKFSSTVPKGHVLSQIPVAGREVKENRTVTLTVSKGLREIQLPSFRGRSKRQVEIALQQMGLVKDSILYSKHGTIPYGVVIRTSPGQGEWVKVGANVNIVISSGMGSGVYLPNLIGHSFQVGNDKMDSLGFVVKKEEFVADDKDILPETIMDQFPLGGEYLSEGDTVLLKVSK